MRRNQNGKSRDLAVLISHCSLHWSSRHCFTNSRSNICLGGGLARRHAATKIMYTCGSRTKASRTRSWMRRAHRSPSEAPPTKLLLSVRAAWRITIHQLAMVLSSSSTTSIPCSSHSLARWSTGLLTAGGSQESTVSRWGLKTKFMEFLFQIWIAIPTPTPIFSNSMQGAWLWQESRVELPALVRFTRALQLQLTATDR